MRDPELVARAQRAAARLEAAWERWRTEQDLADTPAQPVVGYVGYALKEPWDQPRAVIGFSADEAERLADHLEHVTAMVPPQTARSSAPKTAQSAVQQWSGSLISKSDDPADESKPVQQQSAAEPKAKLSADRSLPAIYTVPRVAPASHQEPLQDCVGCRGSPLHPTSVWARDGQAPARAQTSFFTRLWTARYSRARFDGGLCHRARIGGFRGVVPPG
jgi:hypothetical protein